MKKIAVLLFATFAVTGLMAQYVTDYMKAAESYFQKGDFASAAEYYEKYLGGGKTSPEKSFNPYAPQPGSLKTVKNLVNQDEAMYKLGECYRQLNYPSKAEPLYRKVLETADAKFPLARYHHATQLRALGDYATAEKEFRAFLAAYGTNDEFRSNAEREIKNLAFIQVQLKRKDLKYYSMAKATGELNATGASYAPSWMGGNTLVFTSTRPLDTTAKTKNYTNRVYEATFSEGSTLAVSLSKLPQENNMHQGVTALSPDGSTLYLTRWGIKGNTRTAALYVSTRSQDGWSEPRKLGQPINVEGANSQQPFVTGDGRYLLFSSNRSGSRGGYDLWYAPIENGLPGEPVNMGAPVNTSFDEQAPSYHQASGMLVYSSNGGVGMGGFDFFQSKGSIGAGWSAPLNLGYPVNSVKDDIYFVSRGTARNMLEDVMLSSDRDAACCLELFYLRKEKPLKQISGRVISCDPIRPLSGVSVSVIDTINNKTVYSQSLGADGAYSFTLEEFQPLKVQAEAKGYFPNSLQAGVPADADEIEMGYPDLCLVPEPPKPDDKFVMHDVYYEFNKSELNEASYPALDSLVSLLNKYPGMTIELSAHTDSKGREAYNQKLSEARAESVVKYLQEKGIAPERLVAKGYGESAPVAPNTKEDGSDNPEGRAKNRRTEFKVIKME